MMKSVRQRAGHRHTQLSHHTHTRAEMLFFRRKAHAKDRNLPVDARGLSNISLQHNFNVFLTFMVITPSMQHRNDPQLLAVSGSEEARRCARTDFKLQTLYDYTPMLQGPFGAQGQCSETKKLQNNMVQKLLTVHMVN